MYIQEDSHQMTPYLLVLTALLPTCTTSMLCYSVTLQTDLFVSCLCNDDCLHWNNLSVHWKNRNSSIISSRHLVDIAFPSLSSYNFSSDLTVNLLQHLCYDESTLLGLELTPTYSEVKHRHHLMLLLFQYHPSDLCCDYLGHLWVSNSPYGSEDWFSLGLPSTTALSWLIGFSVNDIFHPPDDSFSIYC